MFLRQVEIKNFRNLEHVSITLQSGLNAVVGPNNVGKTNLFLAIRHALGSVAARGDQLTLTQDDLFRPARGQPISSAMRVDLTFSALTDDQIAQFFEILDYDPAAPQSSTAKVHFEATWSPVKKRFAVQRWGGRDEGERTQIPNEIIEALPVTFLPALRDAEAALTPGPQSRIARLFEDLARRSSVDHETAIKSIFVDANTRLGEQPLVIGVQNRVRQSTKGMAGSDYAECSINAADPEFSRILRTLRILVDDNAIADLSFNGLGYNNLLYIGTVLTYLEDISDECPILLIEEPEAHLHPQLTVRLGEYLVGRLTDATTPQAIVSTHSPTFAANVKPSQVSIMFKNDLGKVHCNALAAVGLTRTEERQLQRMMDITRASLYFSKALILVEGISDALLIPEVAKRLGHDLSALHVSVIPVCGVSFPTFSKLFKEDGLAIPVAMVTDGDPPVDNGPSGRWQEDVPRKSLTGFERSPRVVNLLEMFEASLTVRVFHSDVTHEYDLADAGPRNPEVMTEVWGGCFERQPQTLNSTKLADAGTDQEARSLVVWRGICRAETSGSKADFAHLLAEWLAINPSSDFQAPPYLRSAIDHVCRTPNTNGPANS